MDISGHRHVVMMPVAPPLVVPKKLKVYKDCWDCERLRHMANGHGLKLKFVDMPKRKSKSKCPGCAVLRQVLSDHGLDPDPTMG